MANSPILGIPQIGENQNNKYLTANNAIVLLESAEEAELVSATTGTTSVTLTEELATRYKMYTVTGATGAYSLIFPSTINSLPIKRWVYVHNGAVSAPMTVRTSASGGNTVVIPAGLGAIVKVQGDHVRAVLTTTGGVLPAYDVGFYVPGLPDDGSVAGAFRFPRAARMEKDFAGSIGACLVNPTSTAVLDVKRNNASIGTISISTSGVFTFATSGSGAEMWAVNDILTITAPTPQDITLSDVMLTLKGFQLG